MGWNKIWKYKKVGKPDSGIKIGCWNKDGALQPLQEKICEIEYLLKSNNFGVLGIVEANFFQDNDVKDVQIDGYKLFWDKGRENHKRKNDRNMD